MPNRKEQRGIGRNIATIGTAALGLRQKTWQNDLEHAQILRAGIDTAAAQLALLTAPGELQVVGGESIETGIPRIDLAAAEEGIRILGWKKLQGIRRDPVVFIGLIQPDDWADLVLPDTELFESMIEMTRLWWAGCEARANTPEGERCDDTSLEKMITLEWSELLRRVYRRPTSDMNVFTTLSVMQYMNTLADQTQDYWIRLVKGSQMPEVSSGPTWYFEQLVALNLLTQQP